MCVQCQEYIAAVVLLKKLADSEEYRKAGGIIKYTRRWELTSNNVTHNYARIQLKRYMSVMANRKIREKYFGFQQKLKEGSTDQLFLEKLCENSTNPTKML